MLATTIYAAAAAAFYAPTTLHTASRSSHVTVQPRHAVVMSENPSRRELLGFTLAVLPVSAAFAVDIKPAADTVSKLANPVDTMEAARAIYGSTIFKLQGKSTSDIANAKDTFKSFVADATRFVDPTAQALTDLSNDIIAAAEKGDAAAAQTALSEFVTIGNLEDLDNIPGRGTASQKQKK